MLGYNTNPMPQDKMMKLFIIQCISSFIAHDYDSGIHYLSEIKQTYAESMTQLNPTLKTLAKEIIQAVDMFNPDSGNPFEGGQVNEEPMQPPQEQSQGSIEDYGVGQPTSVTSELQDLLNRRKAKRKNKE